MITTSTQSQQDKYNPLNESTENRSRGMAVEGGQYMDKENNVKIKIFIIIYR